MFSKWNVASVIIHYIPVKFHSTANALPKVIKEIKRKKKQLLHNTIITDREKSRARRGNCICTRAYVWEHRLRDGWRSSPPSANTRLFFPDWKKEGFESIVILLILYYVGSGNYSIGLCFEVFFALSWKTP